MEKCHGMTPESTPGGIGGEIRSTLEQTGRQNITEGEYVRQAGFLGPTPNDILDAHEACEIAALHLGKLH